MAIRLWAIGIVVSGMALGACDRQRDDVKEKVQDLRAARANTGKVTSDLQQQLDHAKAEVMRLEKEVALAKQGLTPEVRERQQELQGALQRQDKNVQREIDDVQKVAGTHNAEVDEAVKELESLPEPAKVEGHVDSGAQVVPGESKVEIKEDKVNVPIERRRIEQSPQAPIQQQPAPAEPSPNQQPAPEHAP